VLYEPDGVVKLARALVTEYSANRQKLGEI
jgi:hypothetical protein